jgi:hypothetical protein
MPDTTPIETQLAEAQAEATRLREHNATLLSEKKQVQKDYAKLQEDHAMATATLQRLQLDGPVDALVESISTDPKLFKALWAEGHRFALDEQGRPCVQTAEGKPVMVKNAAGEETALAFDAKAIAEYLCPQDTKLHTVDTKRWAHVLVGTRAAGGGATGTQSAGYSPVDKAKPADAPAVQFGLR